MAETVKNLIYNYYGRILELYHMYDLGWPWLGMAGMWNGVHTSRKWSQVPGKIVVSYLLVVPSG